MWYQNPEHWESHYNGTQWAHDKLICIINLQYREYVENILINEKVFYDMKYQSKYNSYIVYDYEPFCMESFFGRFEISGERTKLQFLDYYLNNKMSRLLSLDNLMET